MKGKVVIAVACLVMSVAAAAAFAHRTAHAQPVTQSAAVDERADPAGTAGGCKSPTFRCENCGGPHGGCYGPLCPDCHYKDQNQQPKPVPIIPPQPPRAG